MLLDASMLARRISDETGLQFSSDSGIDANGQQWIELRPDGLDANATFSILISILWRRLKLEFRVGKFARPLLAQMAKTDLDGRSAFRSVIRDCVLKRAAVELQVNGINVHFEDEGYWGGEWSRLSLKLNRGSLELGVDDGPPDFEIVRDWTQRFAAAILAILPLETSESTLSEVSSGFPEGALSQITVNRYERDRRNRAAALAIHGTRCNACEMDFGERYGGFAAGFIEVHHITPVSRLGTEYVINPAEDLVPLCANCHRVAHLSEPPMSVARIKAAIKNT